MEEELVKKIFEIDTERLKAIQHVIYFKDKEFEQNFFGKVLSDSERDFLIKKIYEKIEEERNSKLIEEAKNLKTTGIEKETEEEKILFILKNIGNSTFLLNFFGHPPTEKEKEELELKLKLRLGQLNKEKFKELIKEDFQGLPKSNIYDFVAKYILNFFNGNIIYSENDEEFYVFKENWVVYSELQIKSLIKDILDNQYTIKIATEVIENLKVIAKKAEQIEPPPDLIPLKNGIYSISKKTLLPYSPDYFFKQDAHLNIYFDPTASCPEIENFINEVADDEQTAKLLFEIIAYTLYRENPHQKAFFLVGEGANGKSTFINLIQEFLGRQNVSCYPFQVLEKNRFALANLNGKYANLFADLPRDSLNSVSFFKTLTGGDMISAEMKFRQKAVSFKNFAKLIFSANQFPRIFDDNNAFFRRLVIVNFRKKFIGEKADPNKIKKITTQEELSGLFNICVSILPQILENGFSYQQDAESIRKEYIKKSNSIAYFIEEEIEEAQNDGINAEELYIAYKKFCEKKGLISESLQFFGKVFIQECANYGLIAKKKRTNKATKIIGITLKQEEERQSSVSDFYNNF